MVGSTTVRKYVDSAESQAYLEITTKRFGLSSETMLAILHPEIAGPLGGFSDLLEASQPDEDDAEAVRAELMNSMAPSDLSDLEEAS